MKPGSVVRFRERDWILHSADGGDVLWLRPLTGTTEDLIAVHRTLAELLAYEYPEERVRPSRFPPPEPDTVADAASVRLFWQAARLLLREGAAPLRSLGRISVRPRTYQLVPLMMALRQEVVRLLIADDVGVGKTIEAALIVRELWDRRIIRRFAVLCPPYLTDQWQKELREKFHFEPVVIGSGTVSALERKKPHDVSIYRYYPVQVISIDFVKSPKNRHLFLQDAPELIIVDEAHGATPATSQSRHLRYELVYDLASDPSRHLLLLTATPHSGVAEAFQRLLGLLRPEFESWDPADLNPGQQERLARHFVQRTRKDIEQNWEGDHCFPQRESQDEVYRLSPAYNELFERTYDFCTEIVYSGERLKRHQRRMRYWSALALLRCVMSSPRAAQVALARRRKGEEIVEAEEEADYLPYAFEPSESPAYDEAPTPLLEQTQATLARSEQATLRRLEKMAAALADEDDTKFTGLVRLVRNLLREGFHPIIWCHYVATAEYVGERLADELREEFPQARVVAITGRMGEEERRLQVASLMRESMPVLVATDCLSEGINLQDGFNAVIHYDLPWNPNRLEQREGRVDRYGQEAEVVRAVRYYGTDNPVDGAIIRVLLNKAREIRESLGTHVPVPENDETVIEALVHDLFMRRGRQVGAQLPLDFGDSHLAALHKRWEDDAKRERESRTRFAQRGLRPKEVQRELEAVDAVLGDPEAVRDFVLSAGQRLGLTIRQDAKQPDLWRVATGEAALTGIPDAVRYAIPEEADGEWLITFTSPTPAAATYLGRNHPFVAALAQYLFEQALEKGARADATRCGAIRTRSVDRLTTLLLLRVRYRIEQPGRDELLAEEVLVTGREGFDGPWLPPQAALRLLERARPDANMPPGEKRELVARGLEAAEAEMPEVDAPPDSGLGAVVLSRAAELEAAHRRVLASVEQQERQVRLAPHWPPDLLGLLVLQPVVGG